MWDGNKISSTIIECTTDIIRSKIVNGPMKDNQPTLPKEKSKRNWFSFLKRNKN
jgi:hypothetical protein